MLLVMSATAGTAQAATGADPFLRKPAPQFVLRDLNHKKLNLRAFRGKVVLLNFWATWCVPCQVEMPRFVVWQNQYGPRGLRIIGISMDDDPTLARKLCAQLGVNYPVAMGDEKLGQLYGGVYGLPITYLIDARGKVQAKYQGEADLNAIEDRFKLLLTP
jgi:peroxiredoxin